MLLDRLEFEFTLQLDTPLTIGTGEMRPDPNQKEEETRNLLEIHTDKNGNAYIPASSLKGALKAHFPENEEALKNKIFGEIHTNGKGDMGQLLLYAATSTEKEVVKRTITAINSDTGTADKHKLFTIPQVKENTIFTLKGLYMLREDEQAGELPFLLAKIFVPLKNGLYLGKGTRLGLGKVSLIASKVFHRIVDKKALTLGSTDITQAFIDMFIGNNETNPPLATYRFYCPDAYISKGEVKKVGDRKVTFYLRKPNNEPILLPTSLLGAMRAKAAWLEALKNPDFKDKRFDFHIEKKEIDKLTPFERLFGVSGFKGLLQIETINCKSYGETRTTTFTAIDRLTGGSLATALFTVEAVEKAEFIVTFTKDKKRELRDEDEKIFEGLMEDLCENGIMLGYGAAKGFGWFEVEKV